MLPVLGALIGAGGSIAGAMIGAGAQSDAAEKNYYINLLNYYQRERERNDRIREGRRIEAQQQEGATDAAGNRTRYIPGRGWVTELSDQSKQLQDLQRQEQINVLTRDLPMRRRAMDRQEEQGAASNDVASNLLERFRKGVEEDPEAMRRRMTSAATSAINREYDEVVQAAMRTAVRQGNSNIGKIIGDLSKQRIQQIAQTIAGIPVQARATAEQMTNQREANLLNQYNMLASRGSQVPGVSYAPQNIDGNLNNLMNAFANRLDKGAGLLMNAHRIPGGTMDYMQPDLGTANAVITGSNALGTALERIGSYNNNQEALRQRQAAGNVLG